MASGTVLRPAFVQESAVTAGHEAVSSRYFWLRLKSPQIAAQAQPGQFVMLSAQSPDLGLCDPLLARPLAVLDAHAASGEIQLLYFVAGRGTGLLNRTVSNPLPQKLRIIGPLGRGFTPVDGVDAHIALGGGSGVAPLVFFFRRWTGAPNATRVLILAARAKDQLARREVVAAPGTELLEATDDGSAGVKGTAIDALRGLLDGVYKGKRVAIYAAGPEPMMLAAAALATQRGLPSRVSLEARMACGVGVCRSCVVDGKSPHPKTGLKRRTICQDGPVFDPAELAGEWAECAHP